MKANFSGPSSLPQTSLVVVVVVGMVLATGNVLLVFSAWLNDPNKALKQHRRTATCHQQQLV